MPVDVKMKVLVVDDVGSMRRALRQVLLQLGFEFIDEAEHGQMAFEMLQSNAYGLCISDWNMHPVNGVELVRAVRKDQQLQNLPFIMASTEGRQERMQLAMAAGVDAYIVKPVSVASVQAKIEALLGPLRAA